MELTPENKKAIDGKSYRSLLDGLRNDSPGSSWFVGETGKYWIERMKKLREEPGGNARHVKASKSIGW